jgi:CheY-like chemotaxis protein
MIQSSPKTRVLLVDNDPSQLELIGLSIGSMDKSFTFETATSAEKALELIYSRTFDCIVSDYMIPWMNGLELYEKLRFEGYATPFILFTLVDDEKVAKKALAAGVDVYLGKEPNLDIFSVLAQHIKSLVSSHRAQKALYAHA